MEHEEFSFQFDQQQIFVDITKFGQSRFIYIGPKQRIYDDLSAALPMPDCTTQLLGDKASSELATTLTEFFKAPILVSYGFPLETEQDSDRIDFVKMSLLKRFAAQRKQ